MNRLAAICIALAPGISVASETSWNRPECRSEIGLPLLTRLERGDFTVLDELVAKQALPELYYLLSRHEQMPGTVSEKRIKTIEALQKVPGYAKYLGDFVEKLSEQKGGYNSSERGTCLALLGRVGTPEAFEEIGRFLFDERNPDVEQDPNLPISPNHFLAAERMYEALERRGAAPFKTQNVGRFLLEHVEPMQKWWLSDASKPYRVQKPEVKPPPVSVESAPALPQTAAPPVATMPSSSGSNAWWIFSALILLALAAIFLAAKNRKA